MEKFKKELSEIRWWMFPILLIICIPCLIINELSDNKWFCTFWNWHKAPNEQVFDGSSIGGKCPRCNTNVLQDGDGNWFG